MTHYTLRPLTPADKPVVTPILVREWGATQVVALSLGGVVDAADLPGWLAESDGEVVGLLVEHCRAVGVRRVNATTTRTTTPERCASTSARAST